METNLAGLCSWLLGGDLLTLAISPMGRCLRSSWWPLDEKTQAEGQARETNHVVGGGGVWLQTR